MASVAYLSTSAWIVSQVAQKELEYNLDNEDYYIILLACYSVGILLSLIQAISSLGLLCNCGGHNLKSTATSWIFIQLFLIALCIVAFLLPFAFNYDGSILDVSSFNQGTQNRFTEIFENFRIENSKFAITYAFILNGLSVLVGSVIMGFSIKYGISNEFYGI